MVDREQPIIALVQRAYGIRVEDLVLISSRYSEVFRVTSDKGVRFALFLRRPTVTITEIETEVEILDSINIKDYRIPRVRTVVNPQLSTDASPLVGGFIDERPVVLYEWLDHFPYDGSNEEAIKAFCAYTVLLDALSELKRPAQLSEILLLSGSFENRTFDFRKYASLLSGIDGGTLFLQCLDLCERFAEEVRSDYFAKRELILTQRRSVTHPDPSPSNFGFSSSGDITCIFDFDLCKWSTPLYDIAWMIGSFSIAGLNPARPQHADEICDRFARYVSAVRTVWSGDLSLLLFYLRVRLCISLIGRLEDTFENGFESLWYLEPKILAIQFFDQRDSQLRMILDIA